MSFGLSISLFFIIGVFYIVIVEFYTMMFRITGLTREKARFQVISLLTNSGYSTEESELVVKVLPRRRIARTIMLFGYVFSITIVSVFVNAMMALPNSEKEEIWIPLIVVCILFVIFMLVRRIPVVRSAFNALLEELGRKWLHNDDGNPILLQEEFPQGVIAAATLNKLPSDLRGKTLRQLRLPERYGLQIVYLRRNDSVMVNLPSDTEFQLRDEVVVFGTMKNIHTVFAYDPSKEDNDLRQAARPVPAAEFMHEQDVQNARRAAQAEHAKEAAEQHAEGGAKAEPAQHAAPAAQTAPAGSQGNAQAAQTTPASSRPAGTDRREPGAERKGAVGKTDSQAGPKANPGAEGPEPDAKRPAPGGKPDGGQDQPAAPGTTAPQAKREAAPADNADKPAEPDDAAPQA